LLKSAKRDEKWRRSLYLPPEGVLEFQGAALLLLLSKSDLIAPEPMLMRFWVTGSR